MRKWTSKLVSTLGLTLALVAGSVTSAQAVDAEVVSDDSAFESISASLAAHLTEYGVPASTQAAIIEGWRNGDLPDSMAGAEPTTTSTSNVGGMSVTVSRYADGSVSVTSVEQPVSAGGRASTGRGQLTPMGVSGCTARTSGNYSYRTNCYVDRWDGVTWQNFRADFTFVSKNFDRIDKVYSRNGGVVGATSGGEISFGIVQRTETATSSARAEYVIWATLPYIGYSTHGLGLKVGAGIGGQSYTFG